MDRAQQEGEEGIYAWFPASSFGPRVVGRRQWCTAGIIIVDPGSSTKSRGGPRDTQSSP